MNWVLFFGYYQMRIDTNTKHTHTHTHTHTRTHLAKTIN